MTQAYSTVFSIRHGLIALAIAVAAPVAISHCANSAVAQSPYGQPPYGQPSYSHPTQGLREASDHFREVVLKFEAHVYRSRYIASRDKKLADDLEDASGAFRSAARNPRDLERLLYRWNELTAIQLRVEQVLIRSCERPDPELLRCWEPVVFEYLHLVEEMQCYTGGHGHSPQASRPYQPQYTVPQAGFGYGQYQSNRPALDIDPRRDLGAAIATTLLNRLLSR